MKNPRSDAGVAHADFVSRSVEALHALFVQGQAIDLRAAEPDKSEASHESLLRAILPLLDDAYAIISRVESRFEETADDDPARTEVADIAALAGMALQERRNLLAHPQPCDHWTYLENCERSLRSLGKSVSVVEGALTRYGDLPPRVNRAAELAAALNVRGCYATLRREVARASAQQLGIQPRLQAASKSIASLLNSEAFPSMRLGDRRELRMLQFRIQSWLSSEHPSESVGERTWEEVLTVVSLLAGVNRRSELTTHDAALLADLACVVTRTEDTNALSRAAAPLFGLDPQLDLLLDIHKPEHNERERWRQTITQLATERGVAFQTPVIEQGCSISRG